MMGISKTVIFSLLLSQLILLHAAQVQQQVKSFGGEAETESEKNIDCGAACTERCQLSSRQKVCKRACGTCCARCGCVPPGSSGHQEVCPCYLNQKTHGGKPKCP